MLEAIKLTRYYGGIAAVLDVSFSIKPGEVLGYLGPNGSGKSTTVKMLAGLLRPSRGVIRFGGEDIQDHLLDYKARVGYVPEEANLYSYLTADEYLRLMGRLRGIPEARLTRRIDRFLRLFRLDVERHSTLSSYSKGMRQKVLLAAALLHDPKIVILDEPASGLDVGLTLTLRAVVSGLARDGRIVIYSSHELDTVERISTRVIILRTGRVVADDSVDRLRALTHQASLEDVFARLVIEDDVGAMAGELLDAMRTS
jgi:ABC-2 type transport system ATP-binding protein